MTELAKSRPIWGANAIGAELGLTQRQTYWMLENGSLPARKVGNRWVADAEKLHAFIRNDEVAA